MNLSIGADHAGYAMKRQLIDLAKKLGPTVHDVGSSDPGKPDDCRGFAALVLEATPAGLCHDRYSARQGVEHEDMNVLVLDARVIGAAATQDAVKAFLSARFSGEERHVRRLNKVKGIEQNEFK